MDQASDLILVEDVKTMTERTVLEMSLPNRLRKEYVELTHFVRVMRHWLPFFLKLFSYSSPLANECKSFDKSIALRGNAFFLNL